MTTSTVSQEFLELAIANFKTEEVTRLNGKENLPEEEANLKPCVLIIEDNSELRQYISKLLSEKYNCLTAVNGKQGVDAAIEQVPDLIISDVMMPEMDGFEVSKRIKNDERTSHIPVISLTARGDKVSRIRGWQEQADEYLTKPFDGDELLIRIDNLLSIRNILRQQFSESVLQPAATRSQQAEQIPFKKGLKEQEKENAFIAKLEKIVAKHYVEPDLKVPELAAKVAMTERQLSRKLKGVMGMTPSEYLRNFRLVRAAELLENGETSTNVFMDVGFGSQSYFARCFKAKFGTSPSEYNPK